MVRAVFYSLFSFSHFFLSFWNFFFEFFFFLPFFIDGKRF